MPGRWNQTIHRGYGLRRVLRFAPLGDAAGALDITGWRFLWQLRTSPEAAGFLLQRSSDDASLPPGPAGLEGGELLLRLEAAETEALPAGRLYHDLAALHPDGPPIIILSGFFEVKEPVSKWLR